MSFSSSVTFDLSLEALIQGLGDISWVLVEGWEGGTNGRVKSQLPSLGLGHVWGTTYIPSSLWKQAVASLSMTCMIQTQTGFIILHVLLPLRPHWFLWENLFFSFNFGSARSSFQRRQCHPTPVLLPVKSHEQRSLEGCSPWGLLRFRYDWVTSLSLFTFMYWRKKWQPTPLFLPGEF